MNYVLAFHLSQVQGTFYLDLQQQSRPKAIGVFDTNHAYVSIVQCIYTRCKVEEDLPAVSRFDHLDLLRHELLRLVESVKESMQVIEDLEEFVVRVPGRHLYPPLAHFQRCWSPLFAELNHRSEQQSPPPLPYLRPFVESFFQLN